MVLGLYGNKLLLLQTVWNDARQGCNAVHLWMYDKYSKFSTE